MLREVLLGKSPSHFRVNPIIKAFITSESLLWAGWNFIIPIFAVFATQQVVGGQIQLAASAYSVHLIFRVIFEIIAGRSLTKSSERNMLLLVIGGILLLTLAYIGFSLTTTVLQVFCFYAVAGIGLGIASPPKNTLFSMHLDKGKATAEWGMADATVFISIALAAALGGFIAGEYGFHALFLLSGAINTAAIIPYILYLKKNKTS